MTHNVSCTSSVQPLTCLFHSPQVLPWSSLAPGVAKVVAERSEGEQADCLGSVLEVSGDIAPARRVIKRI